MNYRDYQVPAMRSVLSLWLQGNRSVLGVAATGSGKTVITSGLADFYLRSKPNGRALFLCHREELLTQPIKHLIAHHPSLRPWGIVGRGMDNERWSGRERTPYAARFISSTIQTVAARPSFLDDLLSHGQIDLIIVDEAHRFTEQYERLLADLLERCSAAVCIGVTATPSGAKLPLVHLYEKVAFEIPFSYLVERGFLARPLGHVFGLPVDVSGVRLREDGDFNADQLGSVLDALNVNEIFFEKWQENAQGLPTIAFCASVKQTESLATYFREQGVRVDTITEKTPPRKRRENIEAFRAGELEILINVYTLVEGIDIPSVECIMMCRPFLAPAPYQQCLGRGARIAEGKTSFWVLDFAPLGCKTLMSVGDILGDPLSPNDLARNGVTREQAILAGGAEEARELIDAEAVAAEAVAWMKFNLLAQVAPYTGALRKKERWQ